MLCKVKQPLKYNPKLMVPISCTEWRILFSMKTGSLCPNLTVENTNVKHYDARPGESVSVLCEPGYVDQTTNSSDFLVDCLECYEPRRGP